MRVLEQLSCLDASLAVKPVFQKFQTVVITSGTLSPIDLYPRILNFSPVAIQSFTMTLTRCRTRPLPLPPPSTVAHPASKRRCRAVWVTCNPARMPHFPMNQSSAAGMLASHWLPCMLPSGGPSQPAPLQASAAVVWGKCRDCMCPVVLTRGTDQSPVSTKFDQRGDVGVMRNYGRLLVDLAAAIPDGIVCFFVSYSYMDLIISKWHDLGILQVPAAACKAMCCRDGHVPDADGSCRMQAACIKLVLGVTKQPAVTAVVSGHGRKPSAWRRS